MRSGKDAYVHGRETSRDPGRVVCAGLPAPTDPAPDDRQAGGGLAGPIATRESFSRPGFMLSRRRVRYEPSGARPLRHAASAAGFAFVERRARDENVSRRLWFGSAGLSGSAFPVTVSVFLSMVISTFSFATPAISNSELCLFLFALSISANVLPASKNGNNRPTSVTRPPFSDHIASWCFPVPYAIKQSLRIPCQTERPDRK